MRALLVILLTAGSAWAQNGAPAAGTVAACGPADVSFHVKTEKRAQPLEPVPADAARVYVVEQFKELQSTIGRPTLRIGMDGAWMGATHGDSYFSFAVTPGEHHLCATGQSRFAWTKKQAEFADFTAEAGKAYYFRARVSEQVPLPNTGPSYLLDLKKIAADEGQYLMAQSKFAISKPKK